MKDQKVNVFAVWQHAHLMAYSMTTKHLRNGEEIEPFSEDTAYDFNYQQIRLLRKEVPLKMVFHLNICIKSNHLYFSRKDVINHPSLADKSHIKYILFIRVPVPSQESERSCICVL